jgi:hypothetical protein
MSRYIIADEAIQDLQDIFDELKNGENNDRSHPLRYQILFLVKPNP